MRGRVDGNTLEGNISVSVQDPAGCSAFPQQFTALEQGLFKVLVLLSPGENKFTFRLVTADGTGDGAHVLNITYIPLLQNPPLHLAIMIAKDSPLLIDCPPAKGGSISSAHSSLDAAIAKFRMSAYQWQALTAEDMWTKGLGRRSFRLEEEWAADTTSREFVHSLHDAALYQSGAMRSTAKIHLVRSSKTVAEICDDQLAQQNQSAHSKDKISDYFLEALKTYGGPFESSAHPIVAGMILDSHYSLSQDLILGHAALGCHNPNGISLGMFGSHLTYSWPRFLEEVSFCLRDTRSPGDTVGNDCGECHTMWEACSIGQGAFLHEVGHAFGAPHTTGIMARGYAQDWPKSFLARTAYCAHTNKEGFVVIDGETENEARWDIRDALSFRMLPHFRLPGDKQFQEYIKSAAPTVKANMEGHGEWTLCVSSAYDIARVQFNDKTEPFPSVTQPEQMASYTKKSLEARFDTTEPLRLHVLGLNGKEKVVRNVWRLFRQLSQTQIRIPGSELVLHKRSVTSIDLEEGNNDNKFWEWATLLEHRTESGDIKYATKVEVCTGCILDGAYVHLNGSRINCGPWRNKWG
jgi:hypothetical protein